MTVGQQHSVIFTPSGVRSFAALGETVYETALRAGVDMRSICGGKGLCKRCQIEVESGTHAKYQITVGDDCLSSPDSVELEAMDRGRLTPKRRLACRAKIRGDVIVEIPSDSREVISSIRKASSFIDAKLNPVVKIYMCQLPLPTLDDNPCDADGLVKALMDFGLTVTLDPAVLVKLQPTLSANNRTIIAVVRGGAIVVDVRAPDDGGLYGAAIDIGSTSLAVYVYDLISGHLVYENAAMNPQIKFGEDLMSRVSYVMMNKGGDARLTTAIRTEITQMVQEAADTLAVPMEHFMELVMVGNPIMHHLFFGISPVELGQAPFTLAVKDWISMPAGGLAMGLNAAAQISFLPLIGGHVGADMAGAYLTQMDAMAGRSVLLVDIGTNAEILLTHKGRVVAASSPTGPAFEGAEISAGVRASKGAIERIRIKDDHTTQFKIIGHEAWLDDGKDDLSAHNITGICGSGIFEVMVELANNGLIDESGLFVPTKAPDRFVPEGKTWKYLLVDHPKNKIFIKQTDVRAVQLAKAALNAGVSLLTDYLECDAVEEVLLAGAFGTHLDSTYVADIGIIPKVKATQIKAVGNAAGMGAAMALLDQDAQTRIIQAVQKIERLETATEAKFQKYFVDAMAFPTAPRANIDENRNKRRRRRPSINVEKEQ